MKHFVAYIHERNLCRRYLNSLPNHSMNHYVPLRNLMQKLYESIKLALQDQVAAEHLIVERIIQYWNTGNDVYHG